MTTPGSADQVVFDQVNGLDPNNNGLPYAEVAMLYDAHLLGLSKDYAFPEGGNVAFSRLDQLTTLAKILTRTHSHADGNDYDVWDAIQTILKWVLTQVEGINNDEVNSVNYKPGPTPPAERARPTAPPPAPHGPPPGPRPGPRPGPWGPPPGPWGPPPGYNPYYPPPLPWWPRGEAPTGAPTPYIPPLPWNGPWL